MYENSFRRWPSELLATNTHIVNFCRHPLPTPISPKTRLARGDFNSNLHIAEGALMFTLASFLSTMMIPPTDSTRWGGRTAADDEATL